MRIPEEFQEASSKILRLGNVWRWLLALFCSKDGFVAEKPVFFYYVIAFKMSKSRSARNLLTEIDREELKCLKVAILRHSVPEKASEPSLVRGLDDPKQLNIHFRTDEGRHPLFDREDVVVNIYKAHKEPTLSDQPSGSGTGRARSLSKDPRETYRARSRSRSPLPHTSRESGSRHHDYHSSRNRRSPLPRSKESRRHSKSPGRYENRRSRSRSARGGPSERYRSRSPYRHRVVERERRRTRSRSRSGYRSRSRGERRHSRSPRRDYRRHERERSQRSRSQHRHARYSPGRRRSRSKSPPSRMPDYVYYHGDEYWVPQPMPPRFRGYLPPGPYPRAIPPGPVIMPRLPLSSMMIPPFRHMRLPVYNSRNMPKINTTTATTTTVTTTTTQQGEKTAPVVATSAVVDSSAEISVVSGSDCAKTTHTLHDD